MKRIALVLFVTGLVLSLSACPKKRMEVGEEHHDLNPAVTPMVAPAAPPVIAVGQPAITSISTETLALQIPITITVSRREEMAVNGLTYDFVLGGKDLAHGQEALMLSAREEHGHEAMAGSDDRDDQERTKSAVINVNVPYAQIEEMIEHSGNGRLPFSLSGSVAYTTDEARRPGTAPFSGDGTIAALRPLALEEMEVEVNRVAKSKADLTLEVEVRNPNAFELPVQAFHYVVLIDGHPFASGDASSRAIAGMGRTTITVPVSMSLKGEGEWMRDRIQQRKASYTITYSTTYLVDGLPVAQDDNRKTGEMAVVRVKHTHVATSEQPR